jgi:AraC-like DNA-binding protein
MRRELEETDTRPCELAEWTARAQNRCVYGGEVRDARDARGADDVGDVRHQRLAPSVSSVSAVAALFVDDCLRDASLVSIPRSEIQLVVRFGPSARGGLDAYVFGARTSVRRKRIRAGQRTITARLHLCTSEAVLGVPAPALADRLVPLHELWGDAVTRPLLDQIAAARAPADAATIIERALSARVTSAGPQGPRSKVAFAAAERLVSATVSAVADDLGVSERHLRRVFRDAVGVSPKAFAKLARFHRALGAARTDRRASWSSIAAATGYYDQAHLIDDFRAIAGVTPRALLGELGSTR